MSSCSDRHFFFLFSLRHCVVLHSQTLPTPLSGSRARPQQKCMYLEARQYKAGTRAKHRVLGQPGQAVRRELGSNKKLGSWSLVDGHKSPIGWPVSIRHMWGCRDPFSLEQAWQTVTLWVAWPQAWAGRVGDFPALIFRRIAVDKEWDKWPKASVLGTATGSSCCYCGCRRNFYPNTLYRPGPLLQPPY